MLAIVGSPPSASGSESAQEKLGTTIRVEWREAPMMTAFRPSLQLLVRSTTKEQVFVIVSWEPRMCGGERVQLSRRSSNFVGQLFPQDEYRANLQPGGWIALVYPLGLTVDAATPEPPGSCESRFVVHARQGDRVEEIRFEVPLQPALVDGVDRVH